mmetsp:Transcript_28314/g.72527  ORF Transcript_28314/g.72527 Transcript_28314/m.72527 type:complete len:226 (-) Transcript_28314:566-1243(-)
MATACIAATPLRVHAPQLLHDARRLLACLWVALVVVPSGLVIVGRVARHELELPDDLALVEANHGEAEAGRAPLPRALPRRFGALRDPQACHFLVPRRHRALGILLAQVHGFSDDRTLRVWAKGLVACLTRRLEGPEVLPAAAVAAENPDQHIAVRRRAVICDNGRASHTAAIAIEAAGHLARRALLLGLGRIQDATGLRHELWLEAKTLRDVGRRRESENVDVQ